MTTQALPTTIYDSLHFRVDSAIRQHPHLRGLQIEPLTDGRNVVLKGTVQSFFLKQMAQEAVRSIEGADAVDNQLEVTW